MPTVLELERQKHLVKLDARLGPRELEHRRIYLCSGVEKKLLGLLGKIRPMHPVELEPAAQLDDLLHQFAIGSPLHFPGQIKCLRPWEDEIWELKTRDIRLFGWFVQKDWFICGDVADANVTKAFAKYRIHIEQTRFWRNQLQLDPPKSISGDHADDVISDSNRR